MPLIIPPNVPYQSPLVAVPAFWTRKAVEGPLVVPIEIDWASLAAECVSFNVGNIGTNPLSQIVAMTVDNSASGSDVQVIFPDVGQVLDVPAYETVTSPVFTGGTSFYVSNQGELSVDVTRIIVHNSMPPSLSIPKSVFTSVAGVSGITLTANGTTTIIAANITGTIAAMSIAAELGSATAGFASALLRDGSMGQLWDATLAIPASNPNNSVLANINGINARFVNGVYLDVSAVTAGMTNCGITLNIYYRTP